MRGTIHIVFAHSTVGPFGLPFLNSAKFFYCPILVPTSFRPGVRQRSSQIFQLDSTASLFSHSPQAEQVHQRPQLALHRKVQRQNRAAISYLHPVGPLDIFRSADPFWTRRDVGHGDNEIHQVLEDTAGQLKASDKIPSVLHGGQGGGRPGFWFYVCQSSKFYICTFGRFTLFCFRFTEFH